MGEAMISWSCVRIARVIVVTSALAGALTILPITVVVADGNCTNEQLRSEQGDQSLPDCRAYELVTPSDKGATTPLLSSGNQSQTAIASDGSHVWLSAVEAFIGPDPGPRGVNAVMSRSAEGWAFGSLQPSGVGDSLYSPSIFSSTLATVGVETIVRKQAFVPPSPEHSFLVGPDGGPYSTIATVSFNEENASFLAGASEDGSRAVLASTDHTLAPGMEGTVSGAHDLYEWDGSGQCAPASANCKPINVTGTGSPISRCGAELGRTAKTATTAIQTKNPVSSDGAKIFFTAPDETMRESAEPGCSEPLRIYMRVNGGTPVDISAPQGISDPTGLHDAYYLGATLDGTHVWFASETELTRDDEGIHDLELYEYNTVTGKLVRVSRGESGVAEADLADGDKTELGFSEDGSTLYFKALGKLTANTPAALTGESTAFNAYRYDTSTGATHYAATGGETGGDFNPLQASADGRALLFGSQVDGNQPVTSGPDGPVYSEGFPQIFRYDAESETVVCVSCRPNGGKAHGDAWLIASTTFDNETFGNGITDYQVSDGGRYILFTSTDSLLPQDTTDEETEGIEGFEVYRPSSDVYEWEAQGSGSCVQGRGCLSLISKAGNGHGSFAYGMSADGNDFFFGSYSALVPQDQDTVADIYDARIDGGFPVSNTAPCSGEACRLLGSAPPIFSTPQSFAFYGVGNPHVVTPKHKAHKKKRKRHRKAHKKQKVHNGHGSRRLIGRNKPNWRSR